MPRFIDPEKMRRIREEQDRLLEGASPPRNKKNFRAKMKAQREADLAYRFPESGLYERFSALLESLTLDIKAERSRRRTIEKSLDDAGHSDAPENYAIFKEEKNWYRISVETLSDWFTAVPRLVMITMNSGTEAHASADHGGRRADIRKSKPSNFCTWRQDDMQLTLSCMSKKPYTVTLHIDEGADVELSELCWIDETSLGSALDGPIAPKKFALERIGEKTYRVEMRFSVFNGRMGSLNAAHQNQNAGGFDLRLLLPFVN